jgi:hypothetical protein
MLFEPNILHLDAHCKLIAAKIQLLDIFMDFEQFYGRLSFFILTHR